jgi:ferredoxin
VRLHLDRSACQGHGRCYALAPGLFGWDDDGYALLEADRELTPDEHGPARRATDNCPEFAITLE